MLNLNKVMIKLFLGNRKETLTTTVVDDIIKKEESAKTNYYFNSSQASTNSRLKTELYSNSKFSYNQIEYTHGYKILFYEWSDLTRLPIEFTNKEQFQAFVKKCGLTMDSISSGRLELGTYGLYATCKKDSNEVLIQYTYCALVNAWVDASYPSHTTTTQTKTPPLTSIEKAMLRDEINLHFFENSDLNSKPLIFKSWKELKKFTKKYDIEISEHNEKRLKALNHKLHYGACIKGYRVLTARDSVEKLEFAISIGETAKK